MERRETDHNDYKGGGVTFPQIVIGTSALEIRSWRNADEFRSWIETIQTECLEIGKRTYRSGVCTFSPKSHYVGSPKWVLAIPQDVEVLPITFLTLAKQRSLVVGASSEVIVVDVEDGAARLKIESLTPFYSLLHIVVHEIVIAVFEAELYAFNEGGKIVWNRNGDLVRDWIVDGSTIHVSFCDDEPVAINLLTGAES